MIARDFGLICEIFERFLLPSLFLTVVYPPMLTWKNSCFRMFSSSLHFFLHLKKKNGKGWIENFFLVSFHRCTCFEIFIYVCVKWRYSLTFKITITFINLRVSSGLFELFKNFTIHLKNTRIELQNKNKINV